MKLSKLIEEELRTDVVSFDDVTAAITARLHECVKPLVFEEMRNNYWGHKSHGYQVAWNEGNVWRVRLNGKVICRRIIGHPQAVQWANNHYAAQIIAGLNL